MTQTLEKSTADILVEKQLAAVKNRAIEIWGDKWLINLCYKYAEVIGEENKRAKTNIVRSWFLSGVTPSLESFNNLLACVGCSLSIECKIKLL